MLNNKKTNELYNILESTKQPRVTTSNSPPLSSQGKNGSIHISSMPGGPRLYVKLNNSCIF